MLRVGKGLPRERGAARAEFCKPFAKMAEKRRLAAARIGADKRRREGRGGRKSARQGTKVSKSPAAFVSFVIPVLNDAARLARCLRAIAALEYPAGRTEVIVVDNGSTDESARVAMAAGASVVSCPDVLVGALRNRGAACARGSLLAFVDADHEIDPGWLTAALDALDEPGVALAGALCLAPPDGTWVQQLYGALRQPTVGRREVTWLGSGNMIIRRAAFEQAGGFHPGLSTCEDVDLCRRVRAAGFRIMSDDRVRSVHFGDPATLASLFRSELWRGRHNLQASLRGPFSARDLPSLVVPIVDLTALAAGVLGLGTASLAGGAWLAVGAFAVIAGLAALRGVRMIAARPRPSLAGAGRAFAVACTYDLARALALVVRAGHHRRPARRVAAAAGGQP